MRTGLPPLPAMEEEQKLSSTENERPAPAPEEDGRDPPGDDVAGREEASLESEGRVRGRQGLRFDIAC